MRKDLLSRFKSSPVAELLSPALLRLVLDGRTVKTYDIDRGSVDLPSGAERPHHLRMQIGDFPFDAGHLDTTPLKVQYQEFRVEIGSARARSADTPLGRGP